MLFRQRTWLTLHPDNRERLTPVTLTGEQPVSQFVGDRPPPLARGLEPLSDLGDCLSGIQAVDGEGAIGGGRVHDRTLVDFNEGFLRHITARNNFADGHRVGAGELPVSLVVRGDCHDRPSTVGHEYIVGDPDGQPFVVHRIDGIAAGEHPGLLFLKILTLQIALACRRLSVGQHLSTSLPNSHYVHQRMFRRKHHISGTEERVRTGGEDTNVALHTNEGKLHLGTQ